MSSESSSSGSGSSNRKKQQQQRQHQRKVRVDSSSLLNHAASSYAKQRRLKLINQLREDETTYIDEETEFKFTTSIIHSSNNLNSNNTFTNSNNNNNNNQIEDENNNSDIIELNLTDRPSDNDNNNEINKEEKTIPLFDIRGLFIPKEMQDFVSSQKFHKNHEMHLLSFLKRKKQKDWVRLFREFTKHRMKQEEKQNRGENEANAIVLHRNAIIEEERMGNLIKMFQRQFHIHTE